MFAVDYITSDMLSISYYMKQHRHILLSIVTLNKKKKFSVVTVGLDLKYVY